ncbi:hypothetical protein ACHAWF_013651 [Thalassiosira exigua]
MARVQRSALMSSESVDLLWDESIEELKRLVREEEPHSDDAAVASPPPPSVDDAFRRFAELYVRYSLVLSDLSRCHDESIQPQKRVDVRRALETVVLRIVSLRRLLVKWCPPNPDVVRGGDADGGVPRAPFPWEYFDVGDALRKLGVAPSRLEAEEVPAFLREDGAEDVRRRDAAVARLREAFGSDDEGGSSRAEPPDEGEFEPAAASVAARSDEGSDDASTATSTSSEEEPDRPRSKRTAEAPPEDAAAAKVQSAVRGHFSRKKTDEYKRWLDGFVGLRGRGGGKSESDQLERNLADVRRQRKAEQQYCKENYENDLRRLKDVVREEEGFAMQHELREERIRWITEHTISKNALPDSFEGFYAKDEPQNDGENEGAKEDAKKKDDAKSKGAKKEGGAKKSKDKKGAEAEDVERPSLAAPPGVLDKLRECARVYEERWRDRNVGSDRVRSQCHDAEMAKDLILRDRVRGELAAGVDETLVSNLLKIKAMQEANAKKSKSKKKDGKKGKKGKGKKAGGKKEKPLPGAKLPGMKDASADEMLGVLVQNGLVRTPEARKVRDFVGGFDNAPPELPNAAKQERWIPDNPSAFQLRKAVMEYCILPLGSESIKLNIQDDENIRSILFYGPEGSGKTLMLEAVASEIGALLIDLSSSTIVNSFGGKEGATKLIHMAFTVAKEKAYAPVIIYLDKCHEFFIGKSKKGGAGSTVNAEMQRFQKDLLIYKNQALKKEDRVMVIGCTNMPGSGDVKLLRWKGPSGKPEKQGFFERSLYFPAANQSDRALLWKSFIRRRIYSFSKQAPIVCDIDYSLLASLSAGLDAGKISSVVDIVVSEERVRGLASKALSEHEFCRNFGEVTPQDDERFLAFTRQITNLDSTWKSISGADKKGGDKKKKK